VSWQPRPGNPFHGRLVKAGRTFGFWASDTGWYLIDPKVPSIMMSPGDNPLRREVRMFGVPTSLCTMERGDVSIHASAVEVAGRAVLLAGPSRYGKTTLASALAQAGHRLLAEDSSRCSIGEPPMVMPGPAVVRLRADVVDFVDLPATRVGLDSDGRVGLIIDERDRGDGSGVPLRAILFLRSGSGPPKLEPVRTPDALRDILALTFQLPDHESRAAAFSRVADLAAGVDTLNLRRRMESDATAEVVRLIEDLAASDG
jgi:energy-coupling factor transporter ATP-binding protein EcfA2